MGGGPESIAPTGEPSLSTPPRGRPSLFSRARNFFFYLGLLYPILIATLAVPSVQRQAAFQHFLRVPFFPKFDLPEKYGLAPGKTLNTYLTTSDNQTLGAWFVLSEDYYQANVARVVSAPPSPTADLIRDTLQQHPTILFLHGAAGTRAVPWRVAVYQGFTSRLHANVFAVDYRGFADSTGVPSEDGLELDAYAAWNWLLERGAKPENIVIVGHSLGTGVAGRFMTSLNKDGVKPRGVALLAPFSTLSKLIETYSIFNIPILQPLQMFPIGLKLIKQLIRHEFDTLTAIQDFAVPTLIAHSQDDMDIPHSHSRTLIDALLEPLLPPATVSLPSSPGVRLSTEEFLAYRQGQELRNLKRGEIVRKREVPNFGVVEEFKGLKAPVMYVETFWGSHAKIALQEGLQDQMAKLFDLI